MISECAKYTVGAPPPAVGGSRVHPAERANCGVMHRRTLLRRFGHRSQVPAFLTPHMEAVLACGKYLHVFRECGRAKENPLASQARPTAPLAPRVDWPCHVSAMPCARHWCGRH